MDAGFGELLPAVAKGVCAAARGNDFLQQQSQPVLQLHAVSGAAKPTGAQQSSPCPTQSSTLSLTAVAAIAMAAIGSIQLRPAEAPISAISAAVACNAHIRFWMPSPEVAPESSRAPSFNFARPSAGINTIAEAVTAMPRTLVVVSLPTISLRIAS